MPGTEVKNDKYSDTLRRRYSPQWQRYQIASVRTVTKTPGRAILIDLAIGLGIPLLQIPLRHRYNIFEDIGCLGETYDPPSSTSPHPHRRRLRRLLASNPSTTPAPNFASSPPPPCQPQPKQVHPPASHPRPLHRPLATFGLYSNIAITGLSPWVRGPTRIVVFAGGAGAGIYWRVDPDSAAAGKGGLSKLARWMGYMTAGRRGLSSTGATSKYHSPPPIAPRAAPPTLPVFIRKDTPETPFVRLLLRYVRSYGGISPLDYDAEKAGTLTLGDRRDYSSSASSASSDSDSSASSVHGEEEEEAEIEPACTRPASVQDAADIV
ncbi:hypothetical protein B0H13DRAFT_2683229 [Mycena leptocephala]|nr:hypothetical protein B0H13DRAFT_2683229 [Mycena leptocephala]